jgi:hypothetical protein
MCEHTKLPNLRKGVTIVYTTTAKFITLRHINAFFTLTIVSKGNIKQENAAQ